MRGWIELCSDVNWQDCHGMWAKKAKDGSWYVLRWINLYDATGEKECRRDDIPQYYCEVKRLALSELTKKQKKQACENIGLVFAPQKEEYQIIDKHGELADKFKEYALVQACISYGFGAALHTETGDKLPRSIRAKARRFAESACKD